MKQRWIGLLLLLATFGLFETSAPVAEAQSPNGGTTWYIRADGGTRYSAQRAADAWHGPSQCDGKHDAPFPAAGTTNILGQVSTGVNQPCAFNDYRFLWDDQTYGNNAWVISGGDTVIVDQKAGGWRVGFDQGTSNNDAWCYGGGGRFGCTNPTIPAGGPSQHTRILGRNYASCNTDIATTDRSKLTQIFGGFGVYTPLNVAGAKYLDVQCLEITRHSQCVNGGSPAYPGYCSKDSPVDDYDSDGIEEDASTANLTLTDLWIHGHTGRGIKGPIGGLIVANRVNIGYNMGAGWDFDDGAATPFGPNAEWHFNYSTIEWSGCSQEYPVTHTYGAISCYGQSNGGYGDGVGTAPGQGLDVYIDHSTFRYNVQDGEDFGHVDVGAHTFSITNSQSYANGGGQFKWGWGFTNIIFTNNLVLANCHRMAAPLAGAPSTYNTNLGDFCRSGDALSFNFEDNSTALFANNTIVTYASTTFDMKCVPITAQGQSNCNNAVFTLKNNIVRAYGNSVYDYGGNGTPGGFCGAGCNDSTQNIGTINRDHNIFYGLHGSCIANTQTPGSISGTSTNESCADPLFVGEPAAFNGEASLDNFNFALASNSPAKGTGVAIAGLTTDYNGSSYAKPPSIGALEYASTPKAIAAPTLVSLSFSAPNPIALLVGASATPGCTAIYSDSSTATCIAAGSTFSSDAPSVLSASSTGAVTALAAGSGHLIVTSGLISSSDSVTVTTPKLPASIAVAQPQYGFSILPGATRRLFATVTNGTSNQVTWTVKSGSAQVSSTSGSWVDVTAGASGSSCQLAGSAKAVTSATQFTIEATSADDTSKKAAITFNVCKPTVQIATVPAYRTLYASQLADIQSLVVGSVNDAVHWSIAAQPTGGDGKLVDSASRDALFSATVAGRYTLTSTSLADTNQVATTILYVTGHAMPYRVTRSLTEPVDCTVDPSLKGSVYEVGPSQTYRRIQDVPLSKMAAGSTIRVHNEDTTGVSPTTFNEYLQVTQFASPDQPIRICGIADAAGNLPIIDASSASGRSDTSATVAGTGLVTIGGSTAGAAWPSYTGAQNILIEGLHLRNARAGVTYTSPTGSAASWQGAAACLRVADGHNISLIGNDLDSCGNGAVSAWNGTTWGGSSLNHLWEGNYVHGNGATAGSAQTNHQMYLQGWGQVIQFNRFDQIASGSGGANLKSRGVQDIIRYNYFGDGSLRDLDLVDVQGAAQFMSFADFFGKNSSVSASTYSMDQLAAWQEAWNSHFAYGNIYLNGTSLSPIHFAYDSSAGEAARKGSLYWYSNTFYQTPCSNCSGQLWTMFDTGAADGSFQPQTEFPTVQAFNNLTWMDALSNPAFQWNNYDAFIGKGGGNLLPTGWGADTMNGGSGDGWSIAGAASAYQNAGNLNLHVTGFDTSNIVTSSAVPFDRVSWTFATASRAISTLPNKVCSMPTRFTYLPTLGYAVPRTAAINLGASDTPTQTAAIINIVGSTRRANTQYGTCP